MDARLFVLAGALGPVGIVLLVVPASMTHVGSSGVIASILLRASLACWVAAIALTALGFVGRRRKPIATGFCGPPRPREPR